MKILIKLFAASVLLILVVAIGLLLAFNPNDYKSDVIALAKEHTGRTMVIPGDISLSLFPWVGLELGKIEISNTNGFGERPFAKMEHLQVRAKLWPLFQQKLEADTLIIEGLTLNLAKNKKGVTNWDDLLNNKTKSSNNASKTKAIKNKEVKPAFVLGAFALNGIHIKNANFNWDDESTQQKFAAEIIQLRIGQIKPNSRIPFELQLNFKDKNLKADISLNTFIKFEPSFKQLVLMDTTITSQLKLASSTSLLSPELRSELIQINLNKQTLNIKQLHILENDINIKARISAQNILTQPQFNTHINIPSFNPRSLSTRFNITLPKMASSTALTKLSSSFDVKGNLNKILLSNMTLQLDSTQLKAKANIQLEPLYANATVSIDKINIDSYLPPESKPTKGNKKPDNKNKTNRSTAEAALIPLALLNAVNLDADIKIGQLQIKNTHWEKLHLVSHSKQGNLRIKPLTLHGYNATINSDLAIQTKKQTASLQAYLNIQNIQAGKLLNDFIKKDKLKGLASIKANISTQGITLSQIKKHLNGKLKIQLRDATLKGFDIHHQQKVLEAKLKRKTPPPVPKNAATKIANLTASAIIKNGILTNKDLRAATPLSRIIGHGKVDLVKEKINYVASVKFTSSTSIAAKKRFEDMTVIPLGILISGSFDKPSIDVDYKKALNAVFKKELKKQQNKVKAKINNELKKKEQKMKDDLKKKLENKLKNLFKF
ncbi:MAG: AsmA family protein [Woeseiaceae bacterium]